MPKSALRRLGRGLLQQAGKPPTKPLGGAGVQGNGERWHKPGVGKDQGERHPEDTPRERPETSPPSQTPRNGTRHQLHWGEQAGAETRNKESGNKPPQQTRHRPRPQQRAATTAPKHKEPQRGNASRDSPRTGQTPTLPLYRFSANLCQNFEKNQQNFSDFSEVSES